MAVSSLVGLLGFAQLTLAATGSATSSTIAGVPLGNNGPGDSSSWGAPVGVVVDSSGDLVVSDLQQNVIRKIAADGSSTAFAGANGAIGAVDGTGSTARFASPARMVQDSSGNIFVADRDNALIRKITSAGVVSVFAGSGTVGSADGIGAAASFNSPAGITIDASDNLYVSDIVAHAIRRITPAGSVTTVVAGGASGAADGPTNTATFNTPSDLAWAPSGTAGALYIADTGNRKIRLIDLDSLTVSTVMGSGSAAQTDGTGVAASFFNPIGVAVAAGQLYVADYSKVRVADLVTTAVTTLAGGAAAGFADGTGAAASFRVTADVAPDATGTNLYVTDALNNAVRKIVIASGVVTTVSGRPFDANGTGSLGRFYYPYDIATTSTGNLWVADYGNNSIRQVTPAGDVTTVVGADATTNGTLTDGPAATAGFGALTAIATDSLGNAYVTDSNSVRKITATGDVTTLAGSGTSGLADGTGAAASFSFPAGLAVLANGDLVVADAGNHRLRRVTQAGVVTTMAGSTAGTADGAILSATFDAPADVAVAPDGSIYVVQNPSSTYGNHMVRKISADGSTVSTIVGPAGSSALIKGSGASCTVCDASAPLQTVSIAYDSVHSVMLVGTPGKILGLTTGASPELFSIAGTSASSGYADGNSASTLFGFVNGVAVTANGDIFVADTNNNVVRKLSSVLIDVTPVTTTTTTVATTTSTTVATTAPSSSTTVATTGPTTTKPAATPITTPTATPALVAGAGRIVSPDGTTVSAIVTNNTTTKVVGVCAPSSTPTTTTSTTVVSTTSTTVPVSSTIPADTFCIALPLGTDVTVSTDGVVTMAAGKSVTVRGVGFKASSTVEIWVFSTPKLLGTATVGTNGVLDTTVILPADIGNGTHTLQVEGTNAAGADKAISFGVKVAGSTSTPTVGGSDTSLPYTGPEAALPLLLLSAMGGFAGLWLRRRAY
jgi:sugar lactone lactonase YvrE